MNALPHLAARLIGTPLMIHRAKLDVILSVLGPRIGWPIAERPALAPAPHSVITAPRGLAVIPIHGSLVRRGGALEAESGLATYDELGAMLDAAVADPIVGGIVLDIDSAGGEVGGVFDLAARIHAASARKPVWAVANDLALSAAYLLASAASHVVVSTTGSVGSIGVIALHVDQSVRDAQEGLRYQAVFAGEHKNDLSPHEPLSDAGLAMLRGTVDRVYGLLTQTVAGYRDVPLDAVVATQAGLYLGADAVDVGLADAVGSLDETLDRLHQQINPQPVALPGRPGPAAAGTFQERRMDDHPTPVSEATPVAVPPVPPAAAIATLPIADAIEIAQVCTLAGRSDLIAGFLEARSSPADVRLQLLRQLAAGPEITSRIAPAAIAAPNAVDPDNPLIRAVKARVGSRKES